MALNHNRNTSDFGQVEGSHFGRLDGLRFGNVNILDSRASQLTGELFGTFNVCSKSMFTGKFKGESFNCSKCLFKGTVFEARFVGHFLGSIERENPNQDVFNLGGGFYGKLTGRFVGSLDNYNQPNGQSTLVAARNAVTQTNHQPSTVYFLSSHSIIPNPSAKKGVVNGKVNGQMKIDRATFDKLNGMVQLPLQLNNLKGTLVIRSMAKFSGTFNDKELVEAIRTFNGTVHNGLFNGQFSGFAELEFHGREAILSGTFSGNLVGNFVGNLEDGVLSKLCRAVSAM